jgi:hypothetical protein
MKLNKLAVLGITSAILIGGLGTTFSRAGVTQTNYNPNLQTVAANNILRSGSFVNTEQDHPTTGTVRIITENGKRYLDLDEAFSTATGPDVFIILHRRDRVPVNISEQDYVNLAPLKSFKGAQRYAIPDNLNLDDYQSVAIWCRKFNVTFGYARI